MSDQMNIVVAEDRYRSPAAADPALFPRYKRREGSLPDRIRNHLVNVQPDQPEENWPTARTFRSAIEFVEENASNSPFYLYVDSFTPHETWEAPLHYYDLYGSREDREPICIALPYGPISAAPDYEKQDCFRSRQLRRPRHNGRYLVWPPRQRAGHHHL